MFLTFYLNIVISLALARPGVSDIVMKILFAEMVREKLNSMKKLSATIISGKIYLKAHI